jgi:hypothetical protein
MANVTASFESDGGNLGAQVNEVLQRRMRSIIRQVAADARTNAPVDTGRMAQAIKEDPIESPTPFRVIGGVTSHAPYSIYVHQGTAPHVIRPRNASALRFKAGGETVFASSVNHPGTRARPFLTNAVARVLRDLQ